MDFIYLFLFFLFFVFVFNKNRNVSRLEHHRHHLVCALSLSVEKEFMVEEKVVPVRLSMPVLGGILFCVGYSRIHPSCFPV